MNAIAPKGTCKTYYGNGAAAMFTHKAKRFHGSEDEDYDPQRTLSIELSIKFHLNSSQN